MQQPSTSMLKSTLPMNVSATLNLFRLIRDPSLCLPQATISTFNHLPIPVSKAFVSSAKGKEPDIRAVVLDKDNCFAWPKENTVYKPYNDKFEALRAAYPGSRLLIVSNSAGTGSDPGGREAQLLQKNTGVTVLQHATKKPGCQTEILDYFRNAPDSGVTRPDQIAVVGDRLFTDVMMANMMGSWGAWLRDGVVEERGLFTRLEGRVATYLLRKGYRAPTPTSQFEG
ncbi:MAG: HAD-superfamily phosphatase [Lasallia pustulata]|uniref:HAD-superfamily phosphatase n=1 Tax=Lasallia pustulata TaxID=136370 RepID=A0A5M8PGI1_9LECA|nr:MAG: HAD-superfamily phosphatase [Lasallia pustulata]